MAWDAVTPPVRRSRWKSDRPCDWPRSEAPSWPGTPSRPRPAAQMEIGPSVRLAPFRSAVMAWDAVTPPFGGPDGNPSVRFRSPALINNAVRKIARPPPPPPAPPSRRRRQQETLPSSHGPATRPAPPSTPPSRHRVFGRRFATMVRPLRNSSITPEQLGAGHFGGYEIEGLHTAYVIFRENQLDERNMTLVRLEYQAPQGVNLAMNKDCFAVVGGMTIQNLADLVTVELQGTDVRPVSFSVEGHVLAEDCLFSQINKDFMCKDGFISLVCMTAMIVEEPAEVDAVGGDN